MRLRFLTIISLLISSPAIAQTLTAPSLSPAEQKIAWAKKQIARQPDNDQAYNELAIALARRARETSEAQFYAQADEAVAKSLALKPGNFEAQKAQVWILLGKHEFGQARELARALNQRAPDDIIAYGFLTDANAELGNYEEAEKAAQWMLDIRPGNVPALTRGAYLRELFGDLDGAVEFMQAAYDQTQFGEFEDRAWLLTQWAHLRLMAGKLDEAQELLEQALKLYPGYHYALGTLAAVRTEQQKYPEAVSLLRQRAQAAPHAENLYDLAEALRRAGEVQEARETYARFEAKARSEMELADNANRELIFYYADRARQPAEALRIARIEAGRRHDVYTLDALAWALYANGDSAPARQQIEKALAVGTRDAKLFYHAGAITLKLHDREAAARYLKQALDLNAHSEYAAAARQALSRLASSSPLAWRRGAS